MTGACGVPLIHPTSVAENLMTERTRDFLKPEFKDGERPSGADFGDLIDSFAQQADRRRLASTPTGTSC